MMVSEIAGRIGWDERTECRKIFPYEEGTERNLNLAALA
jgi:hypothetical protein